MKETFKKKTLDVSSKPFTPDTRKIDYSRSELRLIEVLDSVCDKVADYHVHSKEGMQRYAKQESETIDTLNALRNRGVKVDIGMPWELVEKQPNKEIMALKRRCEALAEEYEDDLSAWYFQQQEQPLLDYFCRKNILKGEDQSCLDQPWEPFGLPYSDGTGVGKTKEESARPRPKDKKKDEL
ncbi:putative Protein canopy-like protein 4 [Hypsibius exemplaris]|uniref:DUF3456 domain-containing protein n=1 Tax=Hypsibius exemplaris TaxID=2072580 RepID=A0A1W0WYV2_HYPEX|nr:putative Protein canopy-like protein 4 [Hypsibius exemplaris]